MKPRERKVRAIVALTRFSEDENTKGLRKRLLNSRSGELAVLGLSKLTNRMRPLSEIQALLYRQFPESLFLNGVVLSAQEFYRQLNLVGKTRPNERDILLDEIQSLATKLCAAIRESVLPINLLAYLSEDQSREFYETIVSRFGVDDLKYFEGSSWLCRSFQGHKFVGLSVVEAGAFDPLFDHMQWQLEDREDGPDVDISKIIGLLADRQKIEKLAPVPLVTKSNTAKSKRIAMIRRLAIHFQQHVNTVPMSTIAHLANVIMNDSDIDRDVVRNALKGFDVHMRFVEIDF